ncbi:MAG: type IX secretion system membrane protein PorP/SprF [Flavobacteriales bacterium]|nr:type IX secretion system membrane protein PorP/SprF [Flavobacteriales bacterium]
MIKNFHFLIILAVFAGVSQTEQAVAQDAQFTQFYANQLYLNPAFAGAERCPRMALNYRNEWPALSGQFVTYSASYDQYSDHLQGGIGLLMSYDNAGAGTLYTLNVSGMYAYQIPINRQISLRLAIEAGIHQKSLNWEKLVFGDQIDDRFGFTHQQSQQVKPPTNIKPDFSAGTLIFSETFFAGYSAHHITQPDEGLGGTSLLPRKHTAHAGLVVPFNDDHHDSFISPNIVWQAQGDFRELNLGVFVQKGPAVVGLWYRNGDAFIVLLGMHTDAWKIGYTYDVTTSKLNIQNSNGSHEISFGMHFPCKPKAKVFRLVNCPSF